MSVQEGLKVLQQDGMVFKCYESLHNTVWNSELEGMLDFQPKDMFPCSTGMPWWADMMK